MTDEARHGKQTVDNGIHTPIAYRYANSAARLAATDFELNDLDKFAVDIDTGDVFRLSDPLGPTWVQVGSGGGGGAFLPLAGGTMSGTINMNLNAIVGGTYNGVGLTTGGAATDFLNAQGNYITIGGGVQGALQTWPIAVARSNQNMTGNTTVGRAYAIAAVAQESTSINTISFFCAQNAGGGGTNCGVAIYNNLGVRLAYESSVTANLGINVVQLTNNTGTPVSVPINAGSAYYLVIESDINAFSLVARQTYNPPISASVPPISFFIPNSRTVDPTGLPSNISAFFGQVGSGVLNYWLLAYTT